jgi:hypothetical protein
MRNAVRIFEDEALKASVCCHAPGMFVNANAALEAISYTKETTRKVPPLS